MIATDKPDNGHLCDTPSLCTSRAIVDYEAPMNQWNFLGSVAIFVLVTWKTLECPETGGMWRASI